jgi:hypothetical protein
MGVAMSNRYITTPEQLKAVSMNFGHSSVQMTVDGCGQILPQRQGEVIKALRKNIRDAQEKNLKLRFPIHRLHDASKDDTFRGSPVVASQERATGR